MRRDENGRTWLEETDFIKTKRMKPSEIAEFTAVIDQLSPEDIGALLNEFSLLSFPCGSWDHWLHKYELLIQIFNKKTGLKMVNIYSFKTRKVTRKAGNCSGQTPIDSTE